MFITVLTQVIILLILMLVGVTFTKTKILTESGIKSMTDMVLYTVTPISILPAF